MTDDIFDHFGGNSPRKVEPLGQDDLFDDLMPKPAAQEEDSSSGESPEAASIAEELEVVEDAAVDESSGVDDETSETDYQDDEDDFGGGSHWDSLMESLGLEPPASPSVEKPKVVDEAEDAVSLQDESDAVEIIEDVEVVSTGTAFDKEPAVDLFADDEVSSDPVEESSKEVLSEMFVPRDDEDFDDDEVVSVNIDDDPFAAFHREPEIESSIAENDVEEDEELDSADSLIVDDHFVEFEVKELDRGSKDSDRGRRRRRSGGDANADRGGNRARRDDSSGRGKQRETVEGRGGRSRRNERSDRSDREGRQSREDSRSDRGDRDRDNVAGRGGDRYDENDRPSKRRRKRSKSGDREQQVQEVGASSDSERQPRRGRKRRDRNDGDAPAKKQIVPTWEDAICGVVDQNIKRHKSGSGRGGRRRRNH